MDRAVRLGFVVAVAGEPAGDLDVAGVAADRQALHRAGGADRVQAVAAVEGQRGQRERPGGGVADAGQAQLGQAGRGGRADAEGEQPVGGVQSADGVAEPVVVRDVDVALHRGAGPGRAGGVQLPTGRAQIVHRRRPVPGGARAGAAGGGRDRAELCGGEVAGRGEHGGAVGRGLDLRPRPDRGRVQVVAATGRGRTRTPLQPGIILNARGGEVFTCRGRRPTPGPSGPASGHGRPAASSEPNPHVDPPPLVAREAQHVRHPAGWQAPARRPGSTHFCPVVAVGVALPDRRGHERGLRYRDLASGATRLMHGTRGQRHTGRCERRLSGPRCSRRAR